MKLNDQTNTTKSYLGYIESPSTNLKCLKIRLQQEQETEDIIFNMDLLNSLNIPFLEDIKSLYKVCNNFKSALSHFEMLVHGACIKDYNIAKGIIILIIYLQLNPASKAKVSALHKFPFIKISIRNKLWNKKILSSFESIIASLTEFNTTKTLHKILEKIKENAKKSAELYSEDNSNNNLRMTAILLAKILEFGNQIIASINQSLFFLQDFSNNFDCIQLEIKNMLGLLNDCSGKNIEDIVHQIYPVQKKK